MTEPGRCIACKEPVGDRPAGLCRDCAARRLVTGVQATEADLARGWALAHRDQVATFRGEPLHPLSRLRPGRFAKLTFVTVPPRSPRPIESMWVRVTRRSDGGWHGELDNEPEVLTQLELGSEIVFGDHQVVGVAMDTTSRELPPGEHACAYCDLELRREQQELDEGDVRLLEATRLFGFMVFRIGADDEGPGLAFTVGLAHRFDHPELVCFGADADVLGELVRDLANQVAEGMCFEDGEIRHDVLHCAKVRFEGLPADREAPRREHLGYACWFHRNASFPVLQVIWSDRDGRFPDDPRHDASLARWQVALRAEPHSA